MHPLADPSVVDDAHYTRHASGVPPRIVMADLPTNLALTVKYLMRREHKHPTPDEELRKAKTHLRYEAYRAAEAHRRGFAIYAPTPSSRLSAELLTHVGLAETAPFNAVFFWLSLVLLQSDAETVHRLIVNALDALESGAPTA